jgi:hypothetical protein
VAFVRWRRCGVRVGRDGLHHEHRGRANLEEEVHARDQHGRGEDAEDEVARGHSIQPIAWCRERSKLSLASPHAGAL